jgi:hypothetical protein
VHSRRRHGAIRSDRQADIPEPSVAALLTTLLPRRSHGDAPTRLNVIAPSPRGWSVSVALLCSRSPDVNDRNRIDVGVHLDRK